MLHAILLVPKPPFLFGGIETQGCAQLPGTRAVLAWQLLVNHDALGPCRAPRMICLTALPVAHGQALWLCLS